MKYHRSYDRKSRLLLRVRAHLKDLNSHSDLVCREREAERTKDADKHYRTSRRLIADITKELKR